MKVSNAEKKWNDLLVKIACENETVFSYLVKTQFGFISKERLRILLNDRSAFNIVEAKNVEIVRKAISEIQDENMELEIILFEEGVPTTSILTDAYGERTISEFQTAIGDKKKSLVPEAQSSKREKVQDDCSANGGESQTKMKNSFGFDIQLYIENEGFTVKELAKKSGLSERFITNIINGKETPNFKSCALIMDAVNALCESCEQPEESHAEDEKPPVEMKLSLVYEDEDVDSEEEHSATPSEIKAWVEKSKRYVLLKPNKNGEYISEPFQFNEFLYSTTPSVKLCFMCDEYGNLKLWKFANPNISDEFPALEKHEGMWSKRGTGFVSDTYRTKWLDTTTYMIENPFVYAKITKNDKFDYSEDYEDGRKPPEYILSIVPYVCDDSVQTDSNSDGEEVRTVSKEIRTEPIYAITQTFADKLMRFFPEASRIECKKYLYHLLDAQVSNGSVVDIENG